MTSLVYFSHSYRPRDAVVNDYFVRLMEGEGLLPSLDPPSTAVNSAKLERHLAQTDAMIAVLTERERGTSAHMLYEISLAVRSRKPLLVFVEDTLPTEILPPRILQRRFSIRSFPRRMREHRQSLAGLRDYIGQPPPHYQSLLTRRSCLVIGGGTWRGLPWTAVLEYIEHQRRYDVLTSTELLRRIDDHPMSYDLLREIDVVVAFAGWEFDHRESYLLGVVHGACKPLIILAAAPSSAAPGNVPDEYLPRIVGAEVSVDALLEVLGAELEVFEQDFLDLDDEASKDRYIRFLIDLGGRGRYGLRTRDLGLEVIMGDRYEIQGQAGVVGPHAHVHDTTFSQMWTQTSGGMDLPALAEELNALRAALRAQATTPDEDQVVADIGQAELAAREGNGARALRHLRSAGMWALGVATSLGVGLAVAAIRSATGL